MLYFNLNAALEVTAVSPTFPGNDSTWARKQDGTIGAGWISRWDWSTHPVSPLMFAQQLADSATKLGGDEYMVNDAGKGCSPRFDVVRAPKVGDAVSKGFNGDSYPVGTIARISKGSERKLITVTTTEGGTLRFYRKGARAAWVQAGGTWSLIHGTHYEQNPHV